MALTPLPIPRITAPNWGAQLNNAITSRYTDLLNRILALTTRVTDIEDETEMVRPSGVMEGRTLFQYGPSRSVGVTAQRVHFNRIRERIGSGFWFNAGVGGYCAADTATYAIGAISQSKQGNGINEWAPTASVGTWAAKANQGGVVITWPFGNDARLDGWSAHNSTQAKARAAAVNGLHTLIALARTEFRLESILSGSYTRTNGSPDIVGLASPWAKGMVVTGTGIPANTYVGDMINGGLGGFKLSSSRTTQVDVNATASGTSTLNFFPVYNSAVTWTNQSNTGFSGSGAVRTITNGDTVTWVLHLPEDRRIHWLTTAVDDAEYVAAGAPFGGTGGAGYSIVIDGGTPIVGTTSDQHRYGALALSFSPMAVDLGTLTAGVHTIVVTQSGASKLLTDDAILIGSLTPPTVVLMKEVQLPADYYTLNSATGASYAKTLIYNGFVEDELDRWPADDSVLVLDPIDFGYNLNLHVSDADGAYAHFNDAGERVMADGIMAALNQLSGREGLVWT